MGTFKLEIITPERVAYQDDIDMVIVPAVNGMAGIMSHHTPFFTLLTAGELRIIKGSEDYFLAIGGGYLEVTPEKTVVLVTKAIHADEINEEEVIKAKSEAEEAIKNKPQGQALEEARLLLRSSLVDLKVLKRKRYGSKPVRNIPNI